VCNLSEEGRANSSILFFSQSLPTTLLSFAVLSLFFFPFYYNLCKYFLDNFLCAISFNINKACFASILLFLVSEPFDSKLRYARLYANRANSYIVPIVSVCLSLPSNGSDTRKSRIEKYTKLLLKTYKLGQGKLWNLKLTQIVWKTIREREREQGNLRSRKF